MRYLFFILLIQHFVLICKADDCKKVPKAELFRRADAVFLGTILSVNDSSFEVQVAEFYKGDYLNDTLTGLINQDVIPPKAFTVWLFYAKKIHEGVFLADFCSGSKGFDDPYGAHNATFPPPPPGSALSPVELFAIGQTIKGNAWNEIYFEIGTLRALAF